MTKVFRSTVLGDETTPVMVVEALPPNELAVNHRIADLLKVIAAAREAEVEIARLQRECKHHYFTDERGFPYDIRHCAVCGAHRGYV